MNSVAFYKYAVIYFKMTIYYIPTLDRWEQIKICVFTVDQTEVQGKGYYQEHTVGL